MHAYSEVTGSGRLCGKVRQGFGAERQVFPTICVRRRAHGSNRNRRCSTPRVRSLATPNTNSSSATNSHKEAEKEQAPTETVRKSNSFGDSRNAVRTSGVRGTPVSGGIKNATLRYALPPPAVAVRNLVEQAQLAHLCTVMSNMHHRRAGYPFGTIVDFASDGAGFPIFALSPLAIHTRNLMEDARCCLVVQMPGWNGLANARVTIFGDVYQLPPELQGAAQELFIAKHTVEGQERWAQGNLIFFRMHKITDIYFVGGFGTMSWVDVSEYALAKPDRIAITEPRKTLQVLNDKFSGALRELLSQSSSAADEATLISIDQLGADVRVRQGHEYSVQRISFNQHVQTLDDALAAVECLVT